MKCRAVVGLLRSSRSFSLCTHPLLLSTSFQNKPGVCWLDSQGCDNTSPTPALYPLPVLQINQLEEHWEECSSPSEEYPSESLSLLPSPVLMFLILRAQSRNCRLILHSLPRRIRGGHFSYYTMHRYSSGIL